jgi:hypothetical protein
MSQQTSNLSVADLVQTGSFLKQAEQLLTQEIGWEPQRQLAQLWQPRLLRMRQDLAGLSLFEEPVMLVAVAGGVKAGKSHVANLILGHPVLSESLRHETRRAWAVMPPGVAEADVYSALQPAEKEWIRLVKYGQKIGDRQLILIDLPDFDSESQIADFQENQKIVESILSVADVILFVSCQAHNLTRRSFEWLAQFRRGHGFLFIYNETSGAEGAEGEQRARQLREQVAQAGFSSAGAVIHCPFEPGKYNGYPIVSALSGLPPGRTLRSWRVSERIRLLVGDIREIFETHQLALEKAAENIEQYVTSPMNARFQQTMQQQIQSLQPTFQREMLFRVAGQIGGIFGGFIALRKVLNYWSLPGIWLGSRLMGSTGALVATGSAVFGSLLRTYEAWRDRRLLRRPVIENSLSQQTETIRAQNFSINLELEGARLDPLPETEYFFEAGDQEQLRAQISGQIETAFEQEMPNVLPGKMDRVWGRLRRGVWKIAWNFFPTIILIIAFFAITYNLVASMPFFPADWRDVALPTGFAFYLNILAVVLGLCYFQYLWLLFRLRASARRVGAALLAGFRQQEHPWLASLVARLAAPETWYRQALKLEEEVSQLQNKLRPTIKGIEVI